MPILLLPNESATPAVVLNCGPEGMLFLLLEVPGTLVCCYVEASMFWMAILLLNLAIKLSNSFWPGIFLCRADVLLPLFIVFVYRLFVFEAPTAMFLEAKPPGAVTPGITNFLCCYCCLVSRVDR